MCVLRQGVVNTKAPETCTVIGVNRRTILFHPVQDLKNITDFRFISRRFFALRRHARADAHAYSALTAIFRVSK